KATLGTGFKSPSLYQLFAPATFYGPVGNEDLQPERSVAWDAGIEQEFLDGRLVLGALYFSDEFRNLIDYDYAEGYVNILEASSAGAELVLRARPSGSLELRAGYTLTDAKDETTGEALLRRPRHKFSAALSSDWARKGRLSVEILHLGRRDDLFWTGLATERVSLTACTLLNALASYDLASGLQVFARLDNVLDADYELVKGYGTPGFSLYAGFRLGH
ncbi:MAG: TonB-dependent receptor, partial [Candidatus Aminicenantes bacterium]|nr:TonB-dependent receptor [Candidatus Aminicenantes bacterium]